MLGCRGTPNQEEPKGIEAHDTHTKEDRIFKAGVTNARRLHLISLHSLHACDQSVTSIICGRGFAYISAHPLLGAYYLSIYLYKRMRLLTRVYSKFLPSEVVKKENLSSFIHSG